jgi:hypothetical protein
MKMYKPRPVVEKPLFMLAGSFGMFIMIMSGVYLLKIIGGESYDFKALPYLLVLLIIACGAFYWFSLKKSINNRYFLVWDQKLISWHFQGQTTPVAIHPDDITQIKISGNLIEIHLDHE